MDPNIIQIQKLIEEEIGLNPESMGINSWMGCIHTRMKASGKAHLSEYSELVINSYPELQELIELIVVPETWFYREKKAFDFLQNRLAKEWMKHPHARPMTLLCLPCSTGEEPYSMAMALVEAGMKPGSFRIDAIDISRQA